MDLIFKIEERILNSNKGATVGVLLALGWVLIMATAFGLMVHFS
ncbi:MAG TPA: hypothetical protein VF600_07640 [Abditibacteriaceae bacterium]|jgi:hypothetical protein